MTARGIKTASALLRERRRSEQVLFLLLFISALCLVPLLVVVGVTVGFGTVIALTGILIVALLVVRWPLLGFFLVVGCVLVIDQTPLVLLNNQPEIYVFYWPPSLQGLPDRPIGFFILFVVVVVAIHALLKRKKVLYGGALLPAYLFFMLCVLWGIVHGLMGGGNVKIMVNEVRSFWYLFLGYILAYNLVQSKKHVRVFFWVIIICAGIRALEGCYIYIVILHGSLNGINEIMGHEDSYFWIGILFMILLFSLHSRYWPQFATTLILLPCLLIALVANNRRTDFGALFLAILIAWLLIIIVRPEARRWLVIALLAAVIVVAGYVVAFGNGNGGLSLPARALISLVHPDPRDAASDAYRDIENYDLQYTVKQNPLGLGFGKPFLEPLILPNILSLDPVYLYIPHNTVYWVWMRLGPLGYLALWFLFGSMIARGIVYLRKMKDKYLQLVAIYIVGMIVMEIVVAYYDYQLSFYRNVLYVGMLAGVLMKLPIVDAREEKLAHEGTGTHAKSSLSHVGSGHAELQFSQSTREASHSFASQLD